ncbi:leucyl aminopeptidase [Arthrobacter echini]|uniref:Probable cytosol aminopeptidase n=1 Tax=Arthrobacter echini TaxID=1529066 RepID=A0A4S5E7G8_9MICC|nr:leucyl aminopeptidase [Arthrobacter echini]THJ67518.1 leucyl aminopeptidase [Arthrobacter echini]
MITTTELHLSASAKDLRTIPSDALVVAVAKGADGPVLLESPLPAKAARALGDSLEVLGITGAADEVRRLPGLPETGADSLVLTGVGPLEDGQRPDAETLRRAAGAAVRQLAGLDTVVIALPADTVDAAIALAEGAALGAYSYDGHKSGIAADGSVPTRKDRSAVKNVVVHTDADGSILAPALRRATVLGKNVNTTRSLVNQPPSHLYPETFAQAAKDLTRSLPVKVTVMDEKRLERDGYGGILGVGKGSSRPPRMVKVEYSPAKSAVHLALVGKGITFDSGGLSLKPAAGMQTMKLDMAGAAVVLSTLLAVAELGLPARITAWLCLAENMPSGSAQRPEDVMSIYGGRTVEVLNTDAEGRLVLADGLAAASEEAPDAIIDIATLTGAQLIALGTRVSGVMGDDGVRDAVKAAADRAGEQFWPMPLPEELRPSLDSQVADIANIGERNGGMMTAAVFLREFVGQVDGEKIPWAHLDIAGPAFNEGSPYGYTPKAGTGVGVRTLLAYVEDVLARTERD